MKTQTEKAHVFRALHERDGAFILPNPWDIGSARLLALQGFEALGTTSAGYAFSRGQRDNTIDRAQIMEHLHDIVTATDLPVSADLENGFGDDPATVAETIRLAAAVGVVSASIEDSTNRREAPIFEHGLAVERVRAAVEAARALPFPFLLTARAENYFVGRPDLHDTIQRLQAYQEAGADVLFAPGLRTKEDIAAVVGAVDRPVNVMMGLQGVHFTFEELTRLGVKRVSIGAALYRASMGAVSRAIEEMRTQGGFTFADQGMSGREIQAMFQAWQR